MDRSAVIDIQPLGFPWKTQDPFLFCAHHLDQYPAGNEEMGPAASLAGRNLGSDFTLKDGWRMYHGSKVPGFPSHPHRGFETVTLAKQGFVDHSDSLGAAGRFGEGDVQWMTAGKGVQHCEMFPLLNRDQGNTLEIFQVWLNLPRKNKLVEPHFSMLWQETIPISTVEDEEGRPITVRTIAGSYGPHQAPSPPPDSWASDPQNQVAIWTIQMAPDARWQLPAAKGPINRTLYFYQGTALRVDETLIPSYHSVRLSPEASPTLINGPEESHLLLLQGKPIGEPVAQYGPFVMNTQDEIRQAMMEFQGNQFGGWPWPASDHVHPRTKGRFALHADGREELKS
jgi:redox-sensitive bicupin YhaK (pirin superfamily)